VIPRTLIEGHLGPSNITYREVHIFFFRPGGPTYLPALGAGLTGPDPLAKNKYGVCFQEMAARFVS
jgi:hypothetical protein